MPTVSHATSSGSYEDFCSVYGPGQASSWVSVTGQTLLHLALGNDDSAARVAIATRLLDDGADAAVTFGREGYTTLHVLFGNGIHDFRAEVPLLERLFEGGADVNQVAKKWGTPLQTLAAQLNFSDEDLAPFYDVLFARSDLDLLRKGRGGRSTVESARQWSPIREGLLSRIEDYLHRHGHQADDC